MVSTREPVIDQMRTVSLDERNSLISDLTYTMSLISLELITVFARTCVASGSVMAQMRAAVHFHCALIKI